MHKFLLYTVMTIFLMGCGDDTGSDGNSNQVISPALAPSNYVTTRDKIRPDFGNDAPAKGQSRIDPVTGVKITRLTDASELSGTDDALIVYSRYTPENTDGKYFLAFGSNSTSSWLIERETGNVIAKLGNINNREIGEAHELRWDISGQYPNRLYYRYDMSFYRIDDVGADIMQHTLLKDFSALVPDATKIYNDVEGDSSNDSDHWAFMAVHYNGSTFVVDAFIHYQIATGNTHTMTAADLAGTALDHYAVAGRMPRPNMIEVSPQGTGVVLHFGRAWGDDSYGYRYEDIGTLFDGPHIWPFDFDYESATPVKISVGETHSGWAFDNSGREMFISQNNRTDKLDAIYTSGPQAGYDNRTEIADHVDFGWSNGFHYGKMPESKPGWLFINTYSNNTNPRHDTDWGTDQLLMINIAPENTESKIWRISPNYNLYDGHYRDEAPAAINTLGNRIYLTSNWGGILSNREVFVFDLPENWDEILN